jgi:two-component system chemotaxis response regulator CheB
VVNPALNSQSPHKKKNNLQIHDGNGTRTTATKKQNGLGKKQLDGVICIGASAGGVEALKQLLSMLPKNLDAAVLAVIHLSSEPTARLIIDRIAQNSPMKCKAAAHLEEIRAGVIYIAPANVHMMVRDDKIALGFGPEENRYRPSIDVLFRSAAVNYGNRMIGIILSGYLSDGSMGMLAAKQSGAYCIIQDPVEAEVPDMPRSVLELIKVDAQLKVKEMPAKIIRRLATKKAATDKIPEWVQTEARLSSQVATATNSLQAIGKQSAYSCPDCGGGLWAIENDDLTHFRCHIGHTYLPEQLLAHQQKTSEESLWIAVRIMEERKTLLKKMSQDSIRRGSNRLAETYQQRVIELSRHILRLKQLLGEHAD